MSDLRPSDREELPGLLRRLNPHPGEPNCMCAFCNNWRHQSLSIESLFKRAESENERLKETALPIDGVLSQLEDEMHSYLDQPVTGDFMGLTRAWRQILEKNSRSSTSGRPLLLDLFCGAGGAAMGYHRAGFDILGVDLEPQPRYPFEFIQADALTVARCSRTALNRYYTAIHASPPCQAFTTMSNRWRGQGGMADSHPDLIAQVRILLLKTGLPYVIENVVGARKEMHLPITLHGGMFGLGVYRPRLFETSAPIAAPPFAEPPKNPLGIYGQKHDGRRLWTRKDGSEQRAPKTLEDARQAMGIDWMEWRELAESIPPAYTEYIGRQIIGLCQESAA